MRKFFFFAATFILLQPVMFAQSLSKHHAGLSPLTKKYLAQQSKSNISPLGSHDYVCQTIAGNNYLSALIKVNTSFDSKTISAIGVRTGTVAGNILTIQIPPDKVETLSRIPGIEYLQLDEPVFLTMDSARHDANVDSVHAGINLPMAYTGKNVVVGIIDAGFDFMHPSLMDTSGNFYRVKKVWKQKTSGTPPAGYSYGNELADSTAIWADSADVTSFSHGAHVAGIAAGSGIGSDSTNSRFRGIAYESEMVFVCIKPDPEQWTTTGMTNIIDGIKYIFDYADAIGKPAVVNLSWGCSMGPHDGTSLFSQACDNLCGPGKLFTCAAGNNGDEDIHLRKDFTATDTVVKTIVYFSPYLSRKKTWVDLWGDPGDDFCVKVTLYMGSVAGNSTGYLCLDDSLRDTWLLSNAGDTCYLKISTAAAEYNGKPRVFFDIYNNSVNRVMITVRSYSNAHTNMWTGYVEDYTGYYGRFSSGALPGASNGTRDVTISDFASTHSAIATAAYASKINYTSIDGVPTSYSSYVAEGDITPFSSHGPAADSATKPDIASPGMALGSAISSYDAGYMTGGDSRSEVISCYTSPVNGRNYCYAMMSGTSMASPMTSGIVALLLQACPHLTPDEVIGTLRYTAITDNFTGVIPAQGDNLWGYGKINAYGAIRYTWQHANINSISGAATEFMVYPNPSTGHFTIDYFSNAIEKVGVSVSDITGKTVYSGAWNVEEGNNVKTMDLPETCNGIYILGITSQSGTSFFRMAVQR